MTSGEPRAAFPPRVALFDGVCTVCNRAVRWFLVRDRAARLHYAPLQGETAAALRARHSEIPVAVETLVYAEVVDGAERISLRSEALLRMLAELGGGWRRALWLLYLPRWLRDPPYRVFAWLRYRVFGALDTCPIPTPAERARFLD